MGLELRTRYAGVVVILRAVIWDSSLSGIMHLRVPKLTIESRSPSEFSILWENPIGTQVKFGWILVGGLTFVIVFGGIGGIVNMTSIARLVVFVWLV